MKGANMLRFPVLLCKGLQILIVFAAISVTAIFIHLQIDPQYYARWDARLLSSNGILTHSVFESWNTGNSNDATFLSFDKIKTLSLYCNYLQIIAILFLMFITVQELLNIIRSVIQTETFRQRNILSFQRMQKYLFIIFILSSVTSIDAQQASFHSYSLQFTPLILSMTALIMAEIFKQGNQLLEENQLTI